MSRFRAILLAVLAVVLAVLVVLFFRSGNREDIRTSAAAPAPQQKGSAGPAAAGPPRKVTLFFAREEDDRLVGEEREIPSDPSPVREGRDIIAELIKGPTGDRLATLPEGTKLGQLFITKDGTAYVDFSSDLADKHPSGTDAETSTVFSVVNTLAFNFKNIKKVFILIDGRERETLAGHLSLQRAILPDYSLNVKR